MKPKLTIAVRRGLRTITVLAESDVDADQASACPQFKGRDLKDIRSALLWVACLDIKRKPPRK